MTNEKCGSVCVRAQLSDDDERVESVVVKSASGDVRLDATAMLDFLEFARLSIDVTHDDTGSWCRYIGPKSEKWELSDDA